jgi:tetratricopeptide (TPR) repeat protein
MGYRPGHGAPCLLRTLALLTLWVVAVRPAFPQRGGTSKVSQPEFTADLVVTVIVNVRENGGTPIPGNAFVKISSDFSGLHLTASTQDNAAATFQAIRAGDYVVEVSSTGYITATEQVSIMPSTSTYPLFIYLSPEGSQNKVAPTKTTMNPKLQAEIDKGLDKMRHQQYDAARAHFDKAAKMAPGNPDVQYLAGMLEFSLLHYDLAKARFESALSIFPNHEHALVSLGEVQLRTGQPAEAAKTLEKAYLINGADWRMHFLLAYAYAGQKEYEKARPHAERAAELGKEHGAPARLLVGRIYASEGQNNDAKRAFEGLIRDFPNDPSAQEAKTALAALDKPVVATAVTNRGDRGSTRSSAPLMPTSIPAEPPVTRAWAPPDVDAKEYVLASDVSCPAELMQRTESRTAKQLANFEKFMANEHIEHQEIDAYGNPGPVKAKDFTYLVFINRSRKGQFFLEEERDGAENLSAFPTALASRDLVALGVFLFDPEYVSDVIYKCEGLGEWRGQAAWQIHFEQRKEAPSRLMTWRNNRGIHPVPLKGRVWVKASTYDVVHVETDLREPMPELELQRDHLIVDYGPVQFEHGNTSLWLPWHADLYLDVHGKRYHHRHTLTNYARFSVDTSHQIDAPNEN